MSGSMPNLDSGAEGVESWAGEVRLNLVRLAALIVFYAYHLERFTNPCDIHNA